MIYLVRHGQTVFNREHRMQGRMESELTELGRRQAAAMADLLHDLIRRDPPKPWRIVSSPLGRATETARAIGERLSLPVELDERLLEVDVGQWSGRLRTEIAVGDPASMADPEWCFRSLGGETYDDVMGRVSAWLAEQTGEDKKPLIAVSHGVAGRLLRGAYAGLPREAVMAQSIPQDAVFRLSNGQIDRFDCEPVD